MVKTIVSPYGAIIISHELFKAFIIPLFNIGSRLDKSKAFGVNNINKKLTTFINIKIIIYI